MAALFDTFERTDASPFEDEDSFAFLNRAAGPSWARVRTLADAWFEAFPADHAADLRQRFRGGDWSEHIGAWWELYLYTLFRALGHTVHVHPKLDRVPTRPDFRIDTEGGPVLLEARHVQAGVTSAEPRVGRDAWITSPLNRLSHPRFTVGVRILARGDQQPRRAAVTAGVLDWLNGLDPDELVGAPPAALPRREQKAGAWRFELRAIPMSTSRADRRLVGIYPGSAGYDNTVSALKAALKEKARRYGRPGMPLLLAPLLTSGFTSVGDVAAALFGSEAVRLSVDDADPPRMIRRGDGFWLAGNGPRGTRVSGCLVGDAITPWTAAGRLPRLWVHPAPAHPLPTYFGLPTAQVVDGQVVLSEDDQSGAEVFDLLADWPGPEPAFA